MAALFAVGVPAAARAQAAESAAPQAASTTTVTQGGTVVVSGCLVKESDYRRTHNLGSGALGGVGLGDEFVLVNATVGSATASTATTATAARASNAAGSASTCSETGAGEAYRVTGRGEDDLKGLVGHHIEITGTLKDQPSSKLPREVAIASMRETADTSQVAEAAQPAPAAPMSAQSPAPAPSPSQSIASASASTPTPRTDRSADSARNQLPSTASQTPLVALFGVLFLATGAGFMLRTRLGRS